MWNKIKILLVVPEFPPHHIGGWGVVFENLAKTYQKLWHEVLVLAGDYTKKNIFQKLFPKIEGGIEVVRIPELFTPISLLNTVMPYPFWYNYTLQKIFRKFSPDFVHVHGYWLFMPAQIAKILRKNNIDYTFTIHGAPVSPEKMWNKIISLAYNFYHKWYGFPLLNWAKSITAVSEYAKNFEIFSPWKDAISAIGNGINPEDYKDISEEDIFAKYGIIKDKNTKIILSVGRIEWIKWFDKIIQLIPQMQEKWYDVKYLIAGRDNGEKENLQKLIKEKNLEKRIVFLDFIKWKEKNFFFKNTDLIAIPSITESYGLVGLEARFFKKNIITTFAGWLQDVLGDYKWAFTLENWEKAFENTQIQDEKISEFYYEEICKKYLNFK